MTALPSAQQLKDRAPRWVKDVANTSTRAYGLVSAPLRPGPDFLVVGVKRGGTTSMFNYLLQHPGVTGLFPQSRGKKSTDYFFKGTHLGESWYRSHFHSSLHRSRVARRLGYAPVGGEASPYYLWDPRIAARVRSLAPRVKAVALLRDPVERAWSHYQERTENGVEPLSFAEALAAEPERTAGELERMHADPGYYSEAHDWYAYRARGVYLPQLRNWLSVFPADQLLVLRSEDMYADVQGVFDRTCAFLDLPRFELPTRRSFNASQVRSSVPDSCRAELANWFAPHNRELEAFLGRSLNWT
ncbi:MAG TPA: sulfotransferase [Nocardioidaceae bacterium]|nr:sulfotransferase [Nocardioidaceae bacterium]